MNLRLLKSEKGIGTIVGAVMFLMIAVLFLGGTFLWESTNQAQMTVLGNDRTDEGISVQATHKWNDETETYDVAIKVSNIGIINVEFTRLWILDEDYNERVGIDISCPLPVGGYTSIADSKIVELITSFKENDYNPDIPFNVAETNYYFKVVTARGNIANTRLVPFSILESLWPAVVIPGTSYVTDKDRHVHLEVYNRLDETITIDMIIATRHNPTLKNDIIYVEEFYDPDLLWILTPGDIIVGDFWGENPDVYQKGNTILIELINFAGLVISSYYFTVLP